MYPKLIDSSIKNAERAQSLYWKEIDLLHETLRTREGQKNFVFFEGPPTANGKPGLHHVIARTLKDSICRYKNMQGFYVRRKAGWDTHGLPVEIEVEKKLGLHNKKDIEAYGIDKFIEKCRESVFEYEAIWREMTEEMAYLIDLDHPYVTLQNDYIESVWALLKRIFDKGLIYEGNRILPYCTRCGTGLASHEVAQGYKDRKQETVTVAFKRKDKEEYFLVWTTTPWTLPSNVLLTVNPDAEYARVEQGGHVFIMAKELIGQVMGEDVKILETFPGKSLEYVEYEPIMDFVKPNKKAYYVTVGDYVTLTDGTGIVHTAPAFGEDDYQLGRKYDAPMLQPVNEEGKFTETPWKGRFVMDADEDIVTWLRENGKLYKKQRIDHNYPHCWRCDTPLLYYAAPSWYIEMSKFRKELVANNNTVNWYPDYIGEKRFGNWLENMKDWALSRSRYWGTPLPIWICEDGHKHAIGSIEELKKMATKPIDTIDLHRPYVDEVEITCPECGKPMKRVPYVIDVWFDSGAMPFAQLHWPFEHQDDFDEYFPADFISEGIDQTRGWFNSLLSISTLITGKAPYKNVLVNDMLLDKDGKKMSKHVGNTINPFDLFEQYGADAVRWYLNYTSPAWQPTKFDIAGVKEVLSKFFNTLKNVYNLFSLYANYDSIDASKLEIEPKDRSELDRWILSKTNKLIQDVTNAYESFDLTIVTRLIQDYVNDDLSNWYIRRSRRRFWQSGMTEDKKAVFRTTYEVLKTVTLLSAPIVPFVSEEIYRALTNEVSVHLANFPKHDETLIDEQLMKKMEMAKTIVQLGRASRESVSIKVRQPLSRVLLSKTLKDELSSLEDVIMEELNVKAIDYIEDDAEYLNFQLKPVFPVLGPILGSKMGLFQKELKQRDPKELSRKLRAGEKVTFDLGGEAFEFSKEHIDVTVTAKENYNVMTEQDLYVILDTSLGDELVKEGYAREFVSNIQQTRKAMDLNVSDKIKVTYTSTPEFVEAIKLYDGFIKTEVLATELKEAQNDGENLVLNGQPTQIKVEKVQ
ncbi:isoleucine--tRNA ligase [Guggenheimella bovis]